MSYLNDEAMDSGLDWIDTTGDKLHILSQEVSTFGDCTTYSLGNKDTIAIAAPSDRSPTGREVVISAITDGNVTADGTASHWAITDDSSILVACGALASQQAVSNGNTFTLTEFAIGYPDPT